MAPRGGRRIRSERFIPYDPHRVRTPRRAHPLSQVENASDDIPPTTAEAPPPTTAEAARETTAEAGPQVNREGAPSPDPLPSMTPTDEHGGFASRQPIDARHVPMDLSQRTQDELEAAEALIMLSRSGPWTHAAASPSAGSSSSAAHTTGVGGASGSGQVADGPAETTSGAGRSGEPSDSADQQEDTEEDASQQQASQHLYIGSFLNGQDVPAGLSEEALAGRSNDSSRPPLEFIFPSPPTQAAEQEFALPDSITAQDNQTVEEEEELEVLDADIDTGEGVHRDPEEQNPGEELPAQEVDNPRPRFWLNSSDTQPSYAFRASGTPLPPVPPEHILRSTHTPPPAPQEVLLSPSPPGDTETSTRPAAQPVRDLMTEILEGELTHDGDESASDTRESESESEFEDYSASDRGRASTRERPEWGFELQRRALSPPSPTFNSARELRNIGRRLGQLPPGTATEVHSRAVTIITALSGLPGITNYTAWDLALRSAEAERRLHLLSASHVAWIIESQEIADYIHVWLSHHTRRFDPIDAALGQLAASSNRLTSGTAACLRRHHHRPDALGPFPASRQLKRAIRYLARREQEAQAPLLLELRALCALAGRSERLKIHRVMALGVLEGMRECEGVLNHGLLGEGTFVTMVRWCMERGRRWGEVEEGLRRWAAVEDGEGTWRGDGVGGFDVGFLAGLRRVR
ncbi:hypothetical protein M8818_005044 [Zalaria obscura]|uniref:Uncharacterized protein n=1 Tax=Zalaria obscura TaxID=2024903 RepID=A0ACC3S9X8_9PEZI